MRDSIRSVYTDSETYAPLEQFLARVDDPRPLQERRVLRLRDNINDIVDAAIGSPAGRGNGNALTARREEIETLHQEAGVEEDFRETLSAWRQATRPDAQESPSTKKVVGLFKEVVEDAETARALIEAFEKRRKDESTPFFLPEFLRRVRLSKEKAVVVWQAIVLMTQFNAHLPFK